MSDRSFSQNQEGKILSLATELTNEHFAYGEGTIATKVIMLVQYIDPDGKTIDSYFHAGDPRYSELFGMIETHRLRIKDWFENMLIAKAREDEDDES